MPVLWSSWKKILSCKRDIDCSVHEPKALARAGPPVDAKQHIHHYTSKKRKAMLRARSGCSDPCHSIGNVIHGNTRVMHLVHGESLSSSASSPHSHHLKKLDQLTLILPSQSLDISSARPSLQAKKLSGCYECTDVMLHGPSFPYWAQAPVRDTVQAVCTMCGDEFRKSEGLAEHNSIFHTVMELGEGDSARSIVEIIFQTSWLRTDIPCGSPLRILKVLNTQKIVDRFEDYRGMVKARVSKHNSVQKYSRCLVDGNELLRFYGTSVRCSLAKPWPSSTCLCTLSKCGACDVLWNGFQSKGQPGIYTTATSGKAHDSALLAGSVNAECAHNSARAMILCRVIAGRVKKISRESLHEEPSQSLNEYDSLGGGGGQYSNIEELVVYNANAVLPCFVVMYGF